MYYAQKGFFMYEKVFFMWNINKNKKSQFFEYFYVLGQNPSFINKQYLFINYIQYLLIIYKNKKRSIL